MTGTGIAGLPQLKHLSFSHGNLTDREAEEVVFRLWDFESTGHLSGPVSFVGAGYSSLNLLAKIRPDFVKLDMGLTRGVDTDLYKARVAMKLLEMSRDPGVRTVVKGVETVGEWEWAKEHGADFVQGHLFASPAAIPPIPKSFPAALRV